jgi:protein TonB
VELPALDRQNPRDAALIAVAILLSGVVHGAVAVGVAEIEPPVPEQEVWVEVVVQRTEPPPPPPEAEPPPPEPEPPKPEPTRRPPPEPEVVQHEETTPEPPTPEPPPERRPVRRVSQGLSNESFVPGSGTGLDVRRGNTTAAAATTPQLDEAEAGEFATIPYTSVTAAPRILTRPVLVVPEEVAAAEIQGRVEAILTIGADGSVQDVAVVQGLHPGADAACVTALRGTRWRAGSRDGTPVIVTGVPYSCRFEMQEAG